MKNKGVYYALGAGISWGMSLGIFARSMTAFGFSAMQISAVRTTISAITFIVLALIKERQALKIHLKDSWIFLCSGVISVTMFCWCYFTATAHCSLAVAGILQYTAPIWVVLLSAVVFKERVTKVKAIAMAIAVGGCVLVSGVTEGGNSVSALGLTAGVLSGITYGTYTIFTRFAVPKYSTMTINVWTFVIASVSSMLMSGPAKTISMLIQPEVLPTAIIGGMACAALPYFLYTKAMEMLDNGKTSILATIEPVIATMVSVFLYKEPLSLAAFIGIVLVLFAIIMIALQKSEVKAEQ